ncbi:L-2,4-diaminobutyrate decarboxylase [Roseibium album]|nr:L-2,4-diaminobutyrate decarboxylase [Roseibium album]
MKPESAFLPAHSVLSRVAEYGLAYRHSPRPLHPEATTKELRQAFCVPLPEEPTAGDDVIDRLIAASEPGLVGNTDPNFFAWVMGGSDMVGVSADVLTSVWGQNAAIFQTSPAAAIAEEAVAGWLLELLNLPRDSSVGLVTGATMATFVGLAAARSEVLHRAGYDFEASGLQNAPLIRIYLSDDAHVANHSALRYLGFGDTNLVRIPSDAKGLMSVDDLGREMDKTKGPKMIIGQAGHINSGAFEDFVGLAALARTHNAWLHVDGAFGLWARVLQDKSYMTQGLELADSWSVDGHKWIQIPYDSGFAIVRNPEAHKRAMDTSAGYLNIGPDDGRNPTEYNPELSRRARGFSAWAVLMSLGKTGVRKLVAGHCETAQRVAERLADVPGLEVDGPPDLNQVIIHVSDELAEADDLAEHLATRLNESGQVFVKTAVWKGRSVLRLSFISNGIDTSHADDLAEAIVQSWKMVCEDMG